MKFKKTIRRSIVRSVDVVMDQLETRVQLSTPSSPRPETLSWFDRGERQELVDRLGAMNSTKRTTLQSKLPSSGTSFGAYDDYLKSYMKTRTTAQYYFDVDDVDDYSTFINANLDTSETIDSGNLMVDDRMFPNNANETDYSLVVSGDINFKSPGVGDADFKHLLNRFEFWRALSESAVFDGDAKYADEIMYQLADWSDTFKTLDAPADWSSGDKTGWVLDTAIRGEMWTRAYFTLLSDTGMSSKDHTLFLYKIMQHGDWLYEKALDAEDIFGLTSNRSLTLAKSLLLIGQMFPEFDDADLWESTGRQLLFDAAQAQVYPDGSHVEQSPNYAVGVFEDLLDSRQLDIVNGNSGAWSSEMIDLLENSFESFRQQLSPNGKTVAIGDSNRQLSVSNFLKAGFVLDQIEVKQSLINGYYNTSVTSFQVDDASQFSAGDLINAANKSELMRVTGVNLGANALTVERAVAGTTAKSLDNNIVLYNLGHHPIAKPRVRDVWIFGPDQVTPFLNLPAAPEGALGERGKSYAMPDSGNFIVRSDDTESATQISFDAGTKGGFHGHYDPLSFELSSGGRPLIIDPGPYRYDNSTDRQYVVSTKAHNTINVDQKNVGVMDDPDGTGSQTNPSIGASYTFGETTARMSGWHQGYQYLDGTPVVSRSIWYNYDGVAVIVDWAEATSEHQYQLSFNLPGTTESNTTGVDAGYFRTRYDTGTNVLVKPLSGGSVTAGTMARNAKTFVTGDPDGATKTDAYRFTITKTDDFTVFVTLIQIFEGTGTSDIPDVSASVSGGGSPTQNVTVQLSGDVFSTINFTPPTFSRLVNSATDGTSNDIEYDEDGNLHFVWLDESDQFLKYAVKNAESGLWGTVQTVDNAVPHLGQYLDLKLDNDGNPGVAYFDGTNGDLKYAHISEANNSWDVQTVESLQSTGLYPSLAYARNSNSALISYYHKGKRDLKIATQNTETTWSFTTFAETGDQGRFSRIMLDPNRQDLNARYVIAWEDSTNSQNKYAFNDGGWKIETITDTTATNTGGYLSLAFEDSGSGTTNQAGANNFRYLPRVSYYESKPDPSLKFSARAKLGGWTTQRVDGGGTSKRMGLYTNLIYNSNNKAEIYYFDIKNNKARRARATGTNSGWSLSNIGDGGRSMRIATFGTTVAWSNLNIVADHLSVEIIT